MRKSHSAHQILEKAQDLYSNSRDVAKTGADRANTFVHESPMLSTFLGVGFGFLVGLWMRRHD
ncbi:MAG TPA: hypothetical protein VE981_07585 [Planctomycetota bacterium]|nr:hypothetical protein [Planctomycetota bacterium]